MKTILRIALVLAVAMLAAAPFWAGRADLRLLMEVFSFLALAQMWNLLAGYTGLISVGQQAFVGLGGYLFFSLAMFAGLPVMAALPLAALATAALAVPTGLVAFRLRGAHFAIGTWVIAEVYRLLAAQVGVLGGGSGISLPVRIVRDMAASRGAREMVMYYTGFALGIGAILLVWLLLRSRWGLALTAIRDSETAARAVGVSILRVKFQIYVLTAAVTGLTGAFVFLQKLRITPDAAFSVNEWSAFIIFIVVIGGIGSIEGPIVGTVVFFLLRQWIADWGTWYLMLLGALAIVVMLVDKRGIWGALAARADLDLFATRKRL